MDIFLEGSTWRGELEGRREREEPRGHLERGNPRILPGSLLGGLAWESLLVIQPVQLSS